MDINIDKIIRSNRKTFGLEINSSGKLIIRAPINATNDEIESVINIKSKWISKKLNYIKEKKSFQDLEILDDSKIYYLGKPRNIYFEDIDFPIKLSEKGIVIAKEYKEYSKQVLNKWFRDKAYQLIGKRLAEILEQTGYGITKFGITNARRRWGSCSSKNSVNFSWRLIMAPVKVIDYVIIHELVHTEIKNHSKMFWARVEEIVPNYRESLEWLKNHSQIMDIDI